MQEKWLSIMWASFDLIVEGYLALHHFLETKVSRVIKDFLSVDVV